MREILFVCTGNCVRSIMAEAILRGAGGRRFRALSGGVRPAGFVHPATRETLREARISTRGLKSKPWDKHRGRRFDAVVTLGEEARTTLAAAMPPPPGPSLPVRAHWPLEDPLTRAESGAAAMQAAFRATRDDLQARIARLVRAPQARLKDDLFFTEFMLTLGENPA